METIVGTVRTVKAFDSGFVLAQLEIEDDGGVAAIVGVMPRLTAGEAVEVTGDWVAHPRYGRQFKVASVVAAPVSTLTGLVRYLGGGLIPGVGENTAQKIVAVFGKDTLRVLDAEPHRLSAVPGIGKKKAAAISAAWQTHQAERVAMIWLQGYGASPRLALKIFDRYGGRTVAVIQADPYCLERDVPGVGFLTADRIARALGIPLDSAERVAASLSYVLEQAATEGHVFLPADVLTRRAAELLGVEDVNFVDDMLRVRLLNDARLVADVVAGQRVVYLRYYHVAELDLAQRLHNLTAASWARFWQFAKVAWPALIAAMPETVPLTEQQTAAVQSAFVRPLTVLTGAPGTGKTSCLRAVVQLAERAGLVVALASPTGRAAQRLAEATGRPAQTIHRLLEVDPSRGLLKFNRNESAPLAADLIIVDEASMLDLLLADHLLRAISAGAHLLLVGDIDQLPSVGAGNVLRDVIEAIEGGGGAGEQGSRGEREQGSWGEREPGSGSIPLRSSFPAPQPPSPLASLPNAAVVRLDTIFRQAADSHIIVNAHRINRGQMPVLDNVHSRDFFLFQADEQPLAADLVVDLVRERITKRFGLQPEQIQVLSPMHAGEAGVTKLNQRLQAALNPNTGIELVRGDRTFRPGDRVMQTVNDYEKDVFNGDLGQVLLVDPVAKTLSVAFGGNKIVIYENGDLEHLTHAWAVTIHKSQGSEFPAVVIPLLPGQHIMLQRNLLYTAITRARQLVVLVGDRQAIATAVNNNAVARRYTGLVERL